MIHVVAPHGRGGASSRARVFAWLDQTGVPAVVSSYLSHRDSSPSYLLRHPLAVARAERRLRLFAISAPSLLLLHREASPLSRGAIERRLIKSARWSVFDFDDALHLDWGEGGMARRLAPKAPKALGAVRAADRVIAGNQVLADWASNHNDDVIVIPTCVSPESYRRRETYELADPPRLGWIGTPNNEAYLRLIERPLWEIHRRTGARLTLIGSTERTLGDLEAFIDRIQWSETVQHAALAGIDIGLAPVPDLPYTRGKCGYKLLQYGAARIAMAGSPVGVNSAILGQFGMPAPDCDEDWVDSVVGLLEASTTTRAQLAQRAHLATKLHYSYEAWDERWRQSVGVPKVE